MVLDQNGYFHRNLSKNRCSEYLALYQWYDENVMNMCCFWLALNMLHIEGTKRKKNVEIKIIHQAYYPVLLGNAFYLVSHLYLYLSGNENRGLVASSHIDLANIHIFFTHENWRLMDHDLCCQCQDSLFSLILFYELNMKRTEINLLPKKNRNKKWRFVLLLCFDNALFV